MAAILGKLLSAVFLSGAGFTFYLVYTGMRLRPTDPDVTGAFGLWVGVLVVVSFSLTAGLLAWWLLPNEAIAFRRTVSWGLVAFVVALMLLAFYGVSRVGT